MYIYNLYYIVAYNYSVVYIYIYIDSTWFYLKSYGQITRFARSTTIERFRQLAMRLRLRCWLWGMKHDETTTGTMQWDHAMGGCLTMFEMGDGWYHFSSSWFNSCWGINSSFFADSYTVVSWPTHLATISCVSLRVVVNLCKPTLWLLTYLHRYGKSPIVKSCWIIHAVNESNDRVGKCHGLPSLAEKTQQENSTTWNLDIYTKNYGKSPWMRSLWQHNLRLGIVHFSKFTINMGHNWRTVNQRTKWD